MRAGKKNKRPQISAALDQYRKKKATLIIAKLDRLGPDVAFIANLISVCTKDALPVAIRLGKQLGKHSKEVLSQQNSETADEFVERTRPIIAQIDQQGMTTIRTIRNELNQRKIPTFHCQGKGWYIPPFTDY